MMLTMMPNVQIEVFVTGHQACVCARIRDSRVRRVNANHAQVLAMGGDDAST